MSKLKGMDIRPGMVLPRHTYLGGELKVEDIFVAPNGKISAFIANSLHVFWANEDVSFPRRVDGSTKIWGMEDEKIMIDEICVNDIIPPSKGWDGLPDAPNLREGYLVTAVMVGRQETVLTVWHPGTGRAYRITSLYLPLLQGREGAGELHGPWCKVENYHKSKGETLGNTSGYYSSMTGQPQARFLEAGRRGRPPFDSLPAPRSEEGWNGWILQDGQTPHSQDPRYQEEEEK